MNITIYAVGCGMCVFGPIISRNEKVAHHTSSKRRCASVEHESLVHDAGRYHMMDVVVEAEDPGR